ncbi:hypothetical protein GQ53DRAFT_744027 [Thozetella sp. PMI_491]|nr:hypothetical protein GQ53DRAFT_744027 [Thozetella sp. PMI_491]
MADPKSAVELLPNSPLPAGAKLDPQDQGDVEVYGLGESRAVFVVTTTERLVSIRHRWSSSQDAEFARQLLVALQHRHLKPEKRLTLHVSGTQTTLLDALQPFPLGSEILVKSVDSGISTPADVSYRRMQAGEAESFFDRARQGMVSQVMANRPDLTLERAEAMAKTNFARAAPEGVDTPGHSFIVVETTGENGGKVADFWAVLDKETKDSFCYYSEVDPTKRRMGYGKKMLAAWEHHAAEAGIESIGMNVFEINKPMSALCRSAGFTVKEAWYSIQKEITNNE